MKRATISAALLVALTLAAQSRTLLQRANAIAYREANPYLGQAAAEKAGAKLFRRYCVSCHGQDAKGGVSKAPALASDAVKDAEPAALFWVLRNGSLGSGMPSFSWLPNQQRWQIIAWLQRR